MIDFYMLKPDIVDKQKVVNMGGIPMNFNEIDIAIEYPSFEDEEMDVVEAFDRGVEAALNVLRETLQWD